MKNMRLSLIEQGKYLCEKIGNPEKDLNIVYVTGTNGKGSTCSMLESIFRAAGYKTGLYTSPHLIEHNERIRINNTNISNDDYKEIKEFVGHVSSSIGVRLSTFGLDAIISFEYFKHNKCDIVIVEAGVGGTSDAVNIMDKTLLSIITGVAIDHCSQLGRTTLEIAEQKSGIIKENCPIIFGGTDVDADKVISNKAKLLNAPYYKVNHDNMVVKEMSLNGSLFDFNDHTSVQISLLGNYQLKNAATVLTAIDILRSHFDIPEEAVKKGLYEARWHARFELLSTNPIVLFDGGHNEEGVAVAAESIKSYFNNEKIYVLTGVLRDKQYHKMADIISTVAEKVFTITPQNLRALNSVNWAKLFQAKNINAEAFDCIEDGLKVAIEEARKDNKVLLCVGTFYTYASIVQLLSNNNFELITKEAFK